MTPGNTVTETSYLKDISPVKSKFLFLCSYYVYFISLQKSEKRVAERKRRFNL